MTHEPHALTDVSTIKNARQMVVKGQTFSGCSSLVFLISIVLLIPFLVLFITGIAAVMHIESGAEPIGYIFIVLGSYGLGIGSLSLWASVRAVKLNLLTSKQARSYLDDVHKKQQAQQGSISMSYQDDAKSGALELSDDSDPECTK